MQINLEVVPVPMFSSFSVFAKIDVNLLKEKKLIVVKNHMITKTRVSTSIQIGEACVRVNIQVEGFKTAEKTEFNHFHGTENTSHYFVLSKKQGFEEYKQYVTKVIEHLIAKLPIELDEVTVKLEQPRF